MWEYTYTNELCHHGVKGQKWGVRRFQNADGTLTSSGRKRRSDNYHEDYKKAHSKKGVKQMSDQELRERNNRLQAERQYKDLTRKKNIGKAAVTAFVAGATTIAAVSKAASTYKKYGGPLVNKAMDALGNKVLSGMNLSGPLTI